MYGTMIYTNGIQFGRHLRIVVRFWVSAGTMAFVMSGIHLFVIAPKDLDQKIQESGTYLSTQEGVREASL